MPFTSNEVVSRKYRSWLKVALGVASATLATAACDPTPIQVTAMADGAPGSLRAAINAANTAQTSSVVIEIATPGNYVLDVCGASEDDANAHGDLDLTTSKPVTIRGTVPDVMISQGCAGERVFDVRGGGAFKLADVTLWGGAPTPVDGDGVRAVGDVTLERAELHYGGVQAGGHLSVEVGRVWHGGAVASRLTANRFRVGEGSGIRVSGRAALTNSAIVQNPEGSVVAGELELNHVTIADNSGPAIRANRLTPFRSAVSARSGQPACAPGVTVTESAYNLFSDTSCGLRGTGDAQFDALFLFEPVGPNDGEILPGSELIDRVPASACPLNVDIRGAARPQGAACDVGSFEVAPPEGTGATDLTVAFTEVPARVNAGRRGKWTFTITNKGQNGAMPGVAIQAPAFLENFSVSSWNRALCSNRVCALQEVLQPGAYAGFVIEADVPQNATGDITIDLRAYAPHVLAPYEDDRARATTRIVSGGLIHVVAQLVPDSTYPRTLVVTLGNHGPGPAIGTAARPIRVSFQPSPGVQVTPAYRDVIGEFPGYTNLPEQRFTLSFAASPPTQLGTLRLDPGVNLADETASTPVVYVVPADFAMTGTQLPVTGDGRFPFRFTVTNNGPGTQAASAIFYWDGGYAYAPTRGSVQIIPMGSFNMKYVQWTIGTLAPGQTAVLNGSAPGAPASLSGTVNAELDTNPGNNGASL